MFLAWHEIRRAKLRFGLLAGAVGLLVFLILFQQALLNGLVTQFIGALKNQSADVLVYNDQARKNLEGSVIQPDQLAAVAAIDGVEVASPLGEATFTVIAGGAEADAVLFGFVRGGPGEPSTLSDGRLPAGPAEAVASAKDRDDGFGLGDTVTVVGPGGSLDVEVVGLANDLNYSVAPTLFVEFDTFADAKRIRNGVGAEVAVQPSVVAVAVAQGVDPQTVVDRINASVGGVEALTRQQAVDGSPGVSSVRTSFGVILGLFYLVVPLVTGLFFLIVTFQKASSLTLLRAIGASARTLVVSLLLQVLAVVAVGSLLAFVFYAGALQGVQNLGVRVEVMPALITSLAVLVLALLTSLFAVRRVLRIDPINATTGAGVNV